ncbi:MAG: glycosyltransferase family 29 protein, partial [Gammaproteobacteria bacterium]|nr:glycosyltransferase family 29 protein [Gammaproteobacteria bacterium]
MMQSLFTRFGLARAFRAGRWDADLLQQARSLWNAEPNSQNLLLLLNIQHSLTGFTPEQLRELMDQAEKCSIDERGRYRLAALAQELQLDVVPPPMNSKLLDRYPLLSHHYFNDNNDQLAQQARQSGELSNTLPTSSAPATLPLASSFVEKLENWDNFSRHLRSQTIAVVGNAVSGVGLGSGEAIDQSECVFRFNRAHTQPKFKADYGEKTDIWVVSPGFRMDSVNIPADIVVVSGISPFCKPTRYWQRVARLPVKKILTFPPRVWYRLVKQLEAPPSAGLLALATLAESLDDSTPVMTTGFTLSKSDSANHYGDRGKRSSRHNWQREASLARSLISQLDPT